MKWSLQQLNKIAQKPYHFEEIIDFTDYAKDVSGLLSMTPVHVNGTISYIMPDTYRVQYKFKVGLTLECALTLLPVEYQIIKEYDEIFSNIENDDYYLIENNTLDLENAVWSNIMIEKPIIVKREDAYEILAAQGIILNEDFNDLLEEEGNDFNKLDYEKE